MKILFNFRFEVSVSTFNNFIFQVLKFKDFNNIVKCFFILRKWPLY